MCWLVELSTVDWAVKVYSNKHWGDLISFADYLILLQGETTFLISCSSFCILLHSQASMAPTSLGPWEFVPNMATSSHWALTIAPGQYANEDCLRKNCPFKISLYFTAFDWTNRHRSIYDRCPGLMRNSRKGPFMPFVAGTWIHIHGSYLYQKRFSFLLKMFLVQKGKNSLPQGNMFFVVFSFYSFCSRPLF